MQRLDAHGLFQTLCKCKLPWLVYIIREKGGGSGESEGEGGWVKEDETPLMKGISNSKHTVITHTSKQVLADPVLDSPH